MKRPSFQFYPGDWLRDTALRSCSIMARGLWIDMICLMHEGTPYGHLKVNHKVILLPNLARMVGATLQEVEGCLTELESAGVFNRAEDGTIYSRRMIRDESIRESRASGGKLGGNPNLKVNHKVEAKVNLHANLQPTPSSSSSSSSALKEKERDFAEIPPMSRKEFDNLAEIRAVPKECADWFWNTHDARNWTDKSGQPIRKIEPLLMNAKANWMPRKPVNGDQPKDPKKMTVKEILREVM